MSQVNRDIRILHLTKQGTLIIVASILAYILSSCSVQMTPGQELETDQDQSETQSPPSATTIVPSLTPERATPTVASEPSATMTLTPTITPSPTELSPMLSVTANTNCRTGPGITFPHHGVLLVGEFAEVIAKSTIENYWYVRLPGSSSEPCWLSGAYASVEGDTSLLPEYTPMPTPAPPVGFDLYLQGFEACGSTTYVVFSVVNAGIETLKSANVSVVEFETGNQLYGPDFQRFPFAQVVRPVCPPDHGNILDPGVVAYIHVPLDPVPHGKTARGEIMLCTADWLGGDCVTKEIYFLVE